jgi:hypothetical protein
MVVNSSFLLTKVEQNQGHSTYIRIRPETIGFLKITARARAGFFSISEVDTITKEVTVRVCNISLPVF